MVKNFVQLLDELAQQKLERIEYLLRSAKAWTDVSELPNKKENWDKKDKGEDKATEMIEELMQTVEELAVITQGLDIYRIAKERGVKAEVRDDEQRNDNEEEFHEE